MQTFWSDYSHWNAPKTLTGASCFKASEGVKFTDPTFHKLCALAATEGHNAFAYHVLHHGHGSEHMRAQAEYARSIIGKRPAMFDVEYWPQQSGSPEGVASVSEIITAVTHYRELGGTMHVIYLPRSQWRRMGFPDLVPLARLGLHVINADYRDGARYPGHIAWEPYGGVKPWAVQFLAQRFEGNNVANCTWAQAKAVWTGVAAPVPAPAPTPAPATHTYTVRKGDTMWEIARAHHMTLAELEKLNPHAGHPAGNFDLIHPGDVLRVRA